MNEEKKVSVEKRFLFKLVCIDKGSRIRKTTIFELDEKEVADYLSEQFSSLSDGLNYKVSRISY